MLIDALSGFGFVSNPRSSFFQILNFIEQSNKFFKSCTDHHFLFCTHAKTQLTPSKYISFFHFLLRKLQKPQLRLNASRYICGCFGCFGFVSSDSRPSFYRQKILISSFIKVFALGVHHGQV